MPVSVFTIESVAFNLVNYLFSDSKVSGLIARKTGSLHVHVSGLRPVCAINILRDQSSNKLVIFLDSQVETRSSRLETRYSKLLRIKARGSRLKGLSTYFWVVLCNTRIKILANPGLALLGFEHLGPGVECILQTFCVYCFTHTGLKLVTH